MDSGTSNEEILHGIKRFVTLGIYCTDQIPHRMNSCSHCRDAGRFFNEKTARKELRRYKKKGPDKSTRLLLDEIRKKDLHGKSLLDIGGGIGAITFELIDQGIDTSVHVDASSAYLNISRSESDKRGLKNRVSHIYGDITALTDEINKADIVTLDRVICCYPDMVKLIDRSAEKSNLFYGVVYPRERWPVRMVMRAGNFYFKLRGIDFRTYLHSPIEIDSRIRGNGFHRTGHMQTMIWEVALYERK